MIKLIDLDNNIVDANQILAMGVNSSRSTGTTNCIKITFKCRKEYVYDPNIEQFTLEDFNDVLIVEFGDFNTAKDYLDLWSAEWQAAMK